MIWFTRAFLLVPAASFGGFGVYAFLDPVGFVAQWGMDVSGRHGAFELMGIYGGVSIGLAVLCLAGIVSRALMRPALITLITYLGGYLFGRAVAIGTLGPPEGIFWMFIAFEAAGFGLALVCLLATGQRPHQS